MSLAEATPLIAGIVLATILLAVGFLIGYRRGRRRTADDGHNLSDDDRQQLLQLMQELGAWTHDYAGNVSGNQEQLVRLSEAVQKDGARSPAEIKVVAVLQQIMQNNEQLKSKLDEAEEQLERQTRQIACYLTEARTDGLTGLFNRRALDNRLDELFIGYRAGGRSFVIALIDIDKFKVINDTHGHQAGDQVLKQLASVLRTRLDGSLMVARFGGEEFAAVMDGPLRVAAEKMNELRKAVSEYPMQAGSKTIDVTISVGLSEPRDDMIVSPVLRRADEALYAAKNIGRNRVYFHDGRDPILVGAPEVAK
ncbi:GGDEF domain-containing protein [Rubripirellula reticaptiva]|uniref:diguanylate cyclase n=1 Tax=Rubripirellula reticaptiva TaxID=2528013 RepID=A0A5C6EHA5_9BACT|nr:GGDEF domain-containing protein [Rubripirellula reticaptiva]TWU47864.1 Response regulator PleD [Rubripirellula reticaptiva]